MCVLSTENQTVCALFAGREPGKQDSCRQNRCVRKLGLSTNILNSNICLNIYKKNGDSIVKITIRLWKKTHQQLLSEWVHSMTGQGQVTGVAQRHSLLKV